MKESTTSQERLKGNGKEDAKERSLVDVDDAGRTCGRTA